MVMEKLITSICININAHGRKLILYVKTLPQERDNDNGAWQAEAEDDF